MKYAFYYFIEKINKYEKYFSRGEKCKENLNWGGGLLLEVGILQRNFFRGAASKGV